MRAQSRRVQWRNTGVLGSDQPLNGANLISEATLNVLEPGGRRGVTGVEEQRLHLCHEHISVAEEVARLVSSEAVSISRG